jgi:hypothetical protein
MVTRCYEKKFLKAKTVKEIIPIKKPNMAAPIMVIAKALSNPSVGPLAFSDTISMKCAPKAPTIEAIRAYPKTIKR